MAHDFSEILDKVSRNTTSQNTTTSSYTIAAKTVDINDALSQYFILANSAVGNWRPADDTNQTDYPIVYADVLTGQQDYSFTVDANGNQILDIYKVRILNPNGIDWTTLKQINQDTITDADLSVITGSIPSQYFLTANGIFLVQKPNYNMRIGTELKSGLEISVSRTASYFIVSDTTKKPGIPWPHIEYLSLRPSYFYCLQKGMPQASAYEQALFGRLTRSGRVGGMEDAIKTYWRDRNKDFSPAMSPETISYI